KLSWFERRIELPDEIVGLFFAPEVMDRQIDTRNSDDVEVGDVITCAEHTTQGNGRLVHFIDPVEDGRDRPWFARTSRKSMSDSEILSVRHKFAPYFLGECFQRDPAIGETKQPRTHSIQRFGDGRIRTAGPFSQLLRRGGPKVSSPPHKQDMDDGH